MNKPMKVMMHPFMTHKANINTVSPVPYRIDNDELIQMTVSLQERGDFNSESAASLALALHILNNVVTEKKHEAIFSDFRPFLTHFIDLLQHTSEPEVHSHFG